MTVPIMRRWSGAAGTNNTPAFMTDDESGLTSFTLLAANQILDAVYDTIPSSSRVIFTLFKNGLETPIKLYSNAINPGTDGRVAIGPINLSPGQYAWKSTQVSGTAGTKSLICRFAQPLS